MEHAAVIGIHSALLGIVASGLIGYVLYLAGELDTVERKLITEATKINTVPVSLVLPHTQGEYEDVEFTVVLDKLVSKITSATEDNGGGDAPPTVTAHEVLDLMTVVTHSYPFPSACGRKRGYSSPLDGLLATGAVEFTSAEDVRAWLSDLTIVISGVRHIADRHGATLTHILETGGGVSYGHGWGANPTKQEELDREQQIAHTRPDVRAQYLFHQIAEGQKIGQATAAELFQYDLYRKRLPQRPTILALIAGCVLIAFFGILLPMFRPQTSLRLVLWVPTACYLVVLVYAMVKVMQ